MLEEEAYKSVAEDIREGQVHSQVADLLRLAGNLSDAVIHLETRLRDAGVVRGNGEDTAKALSTTSPREVLVPLAGKIEEAGFSIDRAITRIKVVIETLEI
jgi:hypothetical protein